MGTGTGSLQLISGVGAKGPACFLLDAPGRRLLLDLGEGPPPGLLPDISKIGKVDAVVLSHGHKDHVGGVTLLSRLGNPPVYASAIVARELSIAAQIRPLPLTGTADVLGIRVETGRNGHAPGGIWLRFAVGGGVFYSGDWSAESILYAYDPPTRPAATALLDCSYGDYEKTLEACWSELAEAVDRGPVLLPAPANGRGPEIALQALRRGCRDIFFDEATMQAVRRLCRNDAAAARPEARNDLEALLAVARPIAAAHGLMIAASADGTSGASAALLERWGSESDPAIVFTGYRAPGTPADRLIKNGRARFLRWNVHPRLSDVMAMTRILQAHRVIPAFCDRSQLAALAQALAPARVTIEPSVQL